MRICIFIVAFILLLLVLSLTRNENFIFPADIPQPAGPRGWGYRDPVATYQTLLWDQSRELTLMPDFNSGVPTGYLDLSVPSAPVQKKRGSCNRPPNPPIQARPVAQSPYANWASTLQP